MSVEFIDSNVLVYLFDESDRAKRATAEALVLGAIDQGTASISFQVVQETLHVITRKLKKPANPDEARRFLDAVLLPLWRIMPSAAIYRRCLELQSRYRYGFYDSLIIAAALDAGCTRLWSEDLQPRQQIDTLTIQNPFQP
jgi:predicted nucleic acid-binding protein